MLTERIFLSAPSGRHSRHRRALSEGAVMKCLLEFLNDEVSRSFRSSPFGEDQTTRTAHWEFGASCPMAAPTQSALRESQ